MVFGHYIRNFVRLHACFSAFWNLTGKANKTDQIQPLVRRGHVPLCPLWIRPCITKHCHYGDLRTNSPLADITTPARDNNSANANAITNERRSSDRVLQKIIKKLTIKKIILNSD